MGGKNVWFSNFILSRRSINKVWKRTGVKRPKGSAKIVNASKNLYHFPVNVSLVVKKTFRVCPERRRRGHQLAIKFLFNCAVFSGKNYLCAALEHAHSGLFTLHFNIRSTSIESEC